MIVGAKIIRKVDSIASRLIKARKDKDLSQQALANLAGVSQSTIGNMAWLSVEDHRFKTFTDVRECRKLRKLANTPAK